MFWIFWGIAIVVGSGHPIVVEWSSEALSHEELCWCQVVPYEGVMAYVKKAMYGTLAFLSSLLVIWTEHSACPLLCGKSGLLVAWWKLYDETKSANSREEYFEPLLLITIFRIPYLFKRISDTTWFFRCKFNCFEICFWKLVNSNYVSSWFHSWRTGLCQSFTMGSPGNLWVSVALCRESYLLHRDAALNYVRRSLLCFEIWATTQKCWHADDFLYSLMPRVGLWWFLSG